jgi:hypothetical protein
LGGSGFVEPNDTFTVGLEFPVAIAI